MAGDTVNVYSDSDVQGALVTGDDIAVKLIGNHNIMFKNRKCFSPKVAFVHQCKVLYLPEGIGTFVNISW